MKSISLTKLVGGVALTLACASMTFAQSTTITQTVNKRNTISNFTAVQSLSGTNSAIASPMPVGTDILFTYQLFNGGAPAPGSGEPITITDSVSGALTPGSPTWTTVNGTNLLPYSQTDTTHGWAIHGTAGNVTITPGNYGGPDGSSTGTSAPTALASTVLFNDGVSGPEYVVPGTSYAGQTMTYSVWAYSTAGSTITLTLQDGSQATQGTPAACTLPAATWTRCSVTAAFSGGAASGFTALTTGTSGATDRLWGNQVETSATTTTNNLTGGTVYPGPYIATIGTAITNVATEEYSFEYADFAAGAHTITVNYPGDSNMVASSAAMTLTFDQATATASLADSPAGTSVYGAPVTLTASITGPSIAPTGTVKFMDGATTLGTGTLSSTCTNVSNNYTCTASITLDGTNGTSLLAVGSHSLTVDYEGDSNFSTITSSAITHTVTTAPTGDLTVAATSSLNPSTYGDSVKLTVTVTTNVANALNLNGTVTVTDGATTLGTITCASQNSTTCTGTLVIPGTNGSDVDALFTAGSHTISATYSGDTNY